MQTPVTADSFGHYEFGLTATEEKHAHELHRDSIIIDMLSQYAGGDIFAAYPQDLLSDLRTRLLSSGGGLNAVVEALFWPFEMSHTEKSHLLRDWLLSSGITCGTYDVPVHDGYDPLLIHWDSLTSRYAGLPWLRYVTTAKEIRQAKRDGVLALYGFWQPFISPPFSLRSLDAAYSRGLRSFMLTYNSMSAIGVGCTERTDAGLSSFGVHVVNRCNELGIIVDVSHCGRLTTLDACTHSTRPVNANHTAAKAVYPHARCKSDEELCAIADTGGVIGVVGVPFFLSDIASPTIDHMLDHIDYISSLVGWHHVAVGTDWPMQVPEEVLLSAFGSAASTIGFRNLDNFDVTKRLLGLNDCRDLLNITRGLLKRGYSDEQIRGILGENALKVFENVCG